MQFAQWGRGRPLHDFRASFEKNRSDENTQWYCQTRGGDVVSSLVVYRDRFGLPPNTWGVGCVVTVESLRRCGLATQMLASLIAIARVHHVDGVFLHSDIDTAFYEKFGFQLFPGSEKCMYLALTRGFTPGASPPDYF